MAQREFGFEEYSIVFQILSNAFHLLATDHGLEREDKKTPNASSALKVSSLAVFFMLDLLQVEKARASFDVLSTAFQKNLKVLFGNLVD